MLPSIRWNGSNSHGPIRHAISNDEVLRAELMKANIFDNPSNARRKPAPWRYDVKAHFSLAIPARLRRPTSPNGQIEFAGARYLPGATRGQAGMERAIKDATVTRYHHDCHDHLRSHLADFLDAYDFARRLKAYSGLKDWNRQAPIR